MYEKLICLIGVLILSPVGLAQQDGKRETYPAPRYPELKEIKSAEELLPIARAVVRKKRSKALRNYFLLPELW
jgi:hypothetical protein